MPMNAFLHSIYTAASGNSIQIRDEFKSDFYFSVVKMCGYTAAFLLPFQADEAPTRRQAEEPFIEELRADTLRS